MVDFDHLTPFDLGGILDQPLLYELKNKCNKWRVGKKVGFDR
jgi:hypothetical protein